MNEISFTVANIIIALASLASSIIIPIVTVKMAHKLSQEVTLRQKFHELVRGIHTDVQEYQLAIRRLYEEIDLAGETEDEQIQKRKEIARHRIADVLNLNTRINTYRADLILLLGDKGNELARQLKELIRETEALVATKSAKPRDETENCIAHRIELIAQQIGLLSKDVNKEL